MRGTFILGFYFLMICLAMGKVAQAQPIAAQSQPANLNECLELSKQLEQMATAQKQVMSTMVKKNNAVADSLDQYASEMGPAGQKVKKSDIISLHQSAKAFRGHSVRETELVDKFAARTAALIEKIHECLQSAGYILQGKTGPKFVQNSRESLNESSSRR